MAVSDIRYKRLGYLALSVTDLARSAAFYRDIVGVDAELLPEGEVVLIRCSDAHHDIVLHQGDAPGFRRVGWEMESPAALEAARDHLAAIGIATSPVGNAEAQLLGITEAFRFTEPASGATFEFYASMDKAATPYKPTHTKIERLGHMVLHSPDKEATEAFLLNELNFRASDRIGDVVTFLRCFPNPLHHSFGVGKGENARLGHLNFMVTDIDDIGRANIRMQRNNVEITYGPGRHPTSNSIFFYFLDPDGFTIEYSFGMEEFPEQDAREARQFPILPESFDTWGGAPRDSFSKVGIVESAS